MSTLYYTHPICIKHDNGSWHPESPERLETINRVLEQEAFQHLDRRIAPEARVEDIELVHDPRYVRLVFDNVPTSGHVHLDADTAMSPASGEAALRAAGAITAAVDAVLAGEARTAFCGVRPPGHHAEVDRAMGFCLFNNVAIGAYYARKKHGLRRAAVVDFDVHHGNGTQHQFEDDADLFYASTHQYPCYPGTGLKSETGVAGNIVNCPLRPGDGSAEFRKAFEDRILPALRGFKPELLFISAGFDAHARDPLAQLRLGDTDYAWVTRELVRVAAECCAGRVISTLEGGYDLTALAVGVELHVKALMGS